jgi:hypothetical protein
MKKQKSNNVKLPKSIPILIGILIGGLMFGFLFYWTDVYGDVYYSGFTAGQNSTLNNATLMYQVANSINIGYVNQYNSIPIYFEGRLYQCSNITEVRQ